MGRVFRPDGSNLALFFPAHEKAATLRRGRETPRSESNLSGGNNAILPRYAGIAPVFWCLVNGEEETGVTIHHIAPKVDAGDVFLQATVPIETSDTVKTLYTRVCKAAACFSTWFQSS